MTTPYPIHRERDMRDREILRVGCKRWTAGVKIINQCRAKLGLANIPLEEVDRLTFDEMLDVMNEWRRRAEGKGQQTTLFPIAPARPRPIVRRKHAC